MQTVTLTDILNISTNLTSLTKEQLAAHKQKVLWFLTRNISADAKDFLQGALVDIDSLLAGR